jgi:hypothetical protein
MRHWSLFTITAVGLLTCALARADSIPPNEEACVLKSAGASCDAGVCQTSTCSRIDYAHWDRDASTAPPTTHYSCVLCQPAGSKDAGSMVMSDAGGKAAADAGGSLATDAGASATMDAGKAPASTSKKHSSCAVLATGLANGSGPWLLAGSVGLLLRLRRRNVR